MLKEAIQYVVGLGKANISEVCLPGGVETYSDKPLYRVENHIPMAEPLSVNTLTGLVEYITSDIDLIDVPMLVMIESPTTVKVVSKLNDKRDRECIITASAKVPRFSFNSFVDKEEFCINVQSKFIPNDERALLLSYAGTVESGTVAEYGDDGVSQKATVKTGIASKADAKVPSPLTLMPYRTFLEVAQPESKFIFRMKDYGGSVGCALFEADGGKWEIEAKNNIKEYLENELEGYELYTVIA